jgi:hypothetical protein
MDSVGESRMCAHLEREEHFILNLGNQFTSHIKLSEKRITSDDKS